MNVYSDCLTWPKYRFDHHRKQFQITALTKGTEEEEETEGQENKKKSNIGFGNGQERIEMWKERFEVALYKAKKHPFFQQSISNSKEKRELTPIDALLGSPGSKFILGMLFQLKESKFYLEDLKGNVALDLSKADYTPGFFTEGSIVLLEGNYLDSEAVFQVKTMSLALGEARKSSKTFLGSLDLFATPQLKQGNSKYSLFQTQEERELDLQIPPDSEILFLSEIHLDSPQVLQLLFTLLSIPDDEEPYSAVVLMGNFTSNHKGFAENIQDLQLGLEKLGELIASIPRLSKTHFIIIPGPNDPGGSVSNVWPLPPLPKAFTKNLRAKVPNLHLASNPCRMRFYGKDILIYREDLSGKLRRHCIVPPRDGQDCTETSHHLVKTICDGGHLCPLPLQNRPTHWNLDHCLQIFPLPDVLVLADKQQFSHPYNGCSSMSPGSFSLDGSCISYSPSTSSVDHFRVRLDQ
eukprot:TRINITY_DN2046_c0_g1_i1.p1 TRINITY_DN2046_c0_g1~~TRINITY_DN2046_c0_g1_i1.p1  ORF type:complete len:464 (-),score=143.34 TRINITY_DN2046_c0_g1_i1:39-1430(-)